MILDGGWVVGLAAPIAGAVAQAVPSAFHQWLESPLIKAPVPIPFFVLLIPLFWFLFRGTWRELDVEAQRNRGQILASGKWDSRPAVACVIIALILTMQEYYGGGQTYQSVIRPFLTEQEKGVLGALINMSKYDKLYGYAWWDKRERVA